MLKRIKPLYLVILLFTSILLMALQRLFLHLTASLEPNIFIVMVTVVVMVLLGLFLLGLILFGVIERGMQNYLGKLSKPSTINRWLIQFLDFLGSVFIEEKIDQEMEDEDLEILEAIQMPKKRGRKSYYSYKERRQAVLDWERRGANYHFTLLEFLEERFGITSTGMPKVPIPTFYDWRREILAEAGIRTPKEKKD